MFRKGEKENESEAINEVGIHSVLNDGFYGKISVTLKT